jgi:hypothetical protein
VGAVHICNLYSITTNQAAIIALFRVINRAHHRHFEFAARVADHRSGIIRERARHRREVADIARAMAAPDPESRACACSTPRRRACRLPCVLLSPALPPPGPMHRKWSRVTWCRCERACAGARYRQADRYRLRWTACRAQRRRCPAASTALLAAAEKERDEARKRMAKSRRVTHVGHPSNVVPLARMM